MEVSSFWKVEMHTFQCEGLQIGRVHGVLLLKELAVCQRYPLIAFHCIYNLYYTAVSLWYMLHTHYNTARLIVCILTISIVGAHLISIGSTVEALVFVTFDRNCKVTLISGSITTISSGKWAIFKLHACLCIYCATFSLQKGITTVCHDISS